MGCVRAISINFNYLPGGELDRPPCLYVHLDRPLPNNQLRIGQLVSLKLSEPIPQDLSPYTKALQNLFVDDISGSRIVVICPVNIVERLSIGAPNGLWGYFVNGVLLH